MICTCSAVQTLCQTSPSGQTLSETRNSKRHSVIIALGTNNSGDPKNTKTTQQYVSTIAISIRSCQFELLGIGVVASFKDAHPSNKCNVETSSVKRSVRKCKIMQIWKRSAVRGENSSDIRCSARDSCFASLHPPLTKLKKNIGKRS